MKKLTLAILCGFVICGCQRGPSEVVNKVMSDFGIGERQESDDSGSDKVLDRLAQVGKVEMNRMNAQGREGQVKFQEGQGLEGKYYKEVKVYEAARPVDASAISKPSQNERGYAGYIDYTYRVYQSERRNTRAEAASLNADVATDQRGRETYRYNLSSAGTWDGGEGELVKK